MGNTTRQKETKITMPTWLTRLLKKLISNQPKTRQELIQLLRNASKRHLFDPESLEMIEGALQVSDMQVRDVMVARAQMVVLEQNQSLKDALDIMIKSGHSRFPVIEENANKAVGIILAKDLLRFCFTNKQPHLTIQDLMHETTFIPESKRLDKLLKQFQQTHNHMAIVVDEYSNIAGLVTIEDVLEQIVGKIEDEYYVEPGDNKIRVINKNEFIVQALTPIEDFNHYFKSKFDEKNFDTIGGLVAQRFGHLPKRSEEIEIESFKFIVIDANKRKIKRLSVSRITP